MIRTAPLITALVMAAVLPARADEAEDIFRNGHFFGELRYRYEFVAQDGKPSDAHANTVRASLGFETGLYQDFTAAVEAQAVRHLGNADFNDTTNGKTDFPVIADPDKSEFNQAWLMWTGLPNAAVKGGRQKIKLDNERFVGDVDWRQNDQTFDAAGIRWSPVESLELRYDYIWNANRVVPPDYRERTHLIHGAYAAADWLDLAAYGYLLDLNQMPAQSSQTYGARAKGRRAFTEDLELGYLAEYARQRDYADNPDSFDLHYFHLTPTVSWKDLSLQAGWEVLSGNGTDAFQTPLATLHAFNGWADMFLTTPADGLEDRYMRVSYTLDHLHDWIDGTTLDAIYHDFDAENTSADYGREWDFRIERSFETRDFLTKEWTLTAKYATYDADTLFTDTNKFWLMAGTKF